MGEEQTRQGTDCQWLKNVCLFWARILKTKIDTVYGAVLVSENSGHRLYNGVDKEGVYYYHRYGQPVFMSKAVKRNQDFYIHK